MRATLAVQGAAVRLADGSALASFGPRPETGVRVAIGSGDELLLEPNRELSDDELSFVRALAGMLATALARLRDEECTRYEAVHDPLTGLANLDAAARPARACARPVAAGVGRDRRAVRRPRQLQADQRCPRPRGGRRGAGRARPTPADGRPAGDTVARLGGDEFVVVCEEVDAGSALAVGRRVEEAIRLPVATGSACHQLSASIGIALGHSDPEALLANADAAAFRAKAAGRGCVELFD